MVAVEALGLLRPSFGGNWLGDVGGDPESEEWIEKGVDTLKVQLPWGISIVFAGGCAKDNLDLGRL